MRRIRLVIADRRPIVLQGFASLFAAQTDFDVAASCLDGASCLEAVRNLTPDVVLVEDGLSDVTASEMLAVVKAENLPTRLVFFTASVARGDLAAAIAAGACSAISMRERPETLMQSLRLVAPRLHRPSTGKNENETASENVLAVLTDQERKITRLVARGLSNKAVARQLNVSPGTIKVHLNHIFQKLGLNNRTELAALALSQRYGRISALAALIFAAIGDDQAASAVSAGHTVTDTFTVGAADGTAEMVTIIINAPKESFGASGSTARAVIKARGAANGATGTSISTGKPVDFDSDITGSTFGWTAFNFARPSSGSYDAFMMVAGAVWIYVIDIIYSAAQAFDLRDSLPDVFPSATASGTKELVTVNIPSSADANFDGSDYSALLDPGIYDRPFALGTTLGDTVARGGYEFQIFDADAGQDSANGNGKDNYPHGESGSINALIDHGGFGEATATDASAHAEHGTIQASAEDDSNHGQSQRDLHADGDGSAAAEQHAKHDATPENEANRGQSQRDLHAAPANAANNLHSGSSVNAGGKDQPIDDAGQVETAAAPAFGDSFHFKKEMGASKALDAIELQVGHGPDSTEHGLHTAGHDGLAPIQEADLVGLALAEQNAVDHAKSTEHHLTHDLFV